MSSNEPETIPQAANPSSARPLRRRSSGRVIAGVAAGLADYLNIDPLLVRAVFVGLMIFGGAGLVLYVLAWLLMPDEATNRSLFDSAARLVVPRDSRITAVVAVAAVGFVLFVVLPASDGSYIYIPPGVVIEPGVIVVLVVLAIGVVILRRGGRSAGSPAGATTDAVPAPVAPVTAPHAELAEPHPRVSRGPLGWYVVAAVLLGTGALALLDRATAATVLPGQFFGAVLTIVGIGLLIGSWWGKARLLIPPAVVLLPLAAVASFLTVPLEGGIGDVTVRPANTAELRDEYRIIGGRLVLDLRELDARGPVRIAASVAVGQVLVLVPPRAAVELEAQVGAGATYVFETSQAGTTLTERVVRGGSQPQFVLDLGVGIGQVEVYQLRGFSP